jgi:NADH:ubiquinone oxidoreductase subunit 3 (subunit A)
MFLIPFALSFNLISNFGFFFGVFFIITLAIGIFYEWRHKALDWVENN